MRKSGSGQGLYTIGIAALFMAGFLLLVVFGAQSYRRAVDVRQGSMENRALLAYLAAASRGYDQDGGMSVSEDPSYGTCLTFKDGDTGYVLRICCHEGYLLEEYARANLSFNPKDARKIARTDTFAAEWAGDNLLRVETDAGYVYLYGRSGGDA